MVKVMNPMQTMRQPMRWPMCPSTVGQLSTDASAAVFSVDKQAASPVYHWCVSGASVTFSLLVIICEDGLS